MTFQGWVITIVCVAAAALLLWVSTPVLMPFMAGLILAYILNPLVERQIHWGIPRSLASALPVAVALIVLGVSSAFVVPLLGDQLAAFVQKLPGYINELQQSVIPPRLARLLHLGTLNNETLTAFFGAIGTDGVGWVVGNLQRLYSGAVAAFNMLLLVVMTPLVAFYLLHDWPQLKQRVVNVLPPRWRPSVLKMGADIDVRLAAYLRGQLLVCFILGVFYAVSLELINLELGWALGILAGVLAFIPVLGAMIGVLAMLAMVLVQYQVDAWQPYALVLGVYMLGQLLEGSVLTPYLVGSRVGLHPVWVIFALLVGGEIAGLGGMLLAIPAAVIVSVVVPYLIRGWHQTVR